MGESEKDKSQRPNAILWLKFRTTSPTKATQKNYLYEFSLDRCGWEFCLCVWDYYKLKIARWERCGADERCCARRKENSTAAALAKIRRVTVAVRTVRRCIWLLDKIAFSAKGWSRLNFWIEAFTDPTMTKLH